MSAPGLGAARQAPVAAGEGVPADRHEAYRRGLCGDCLTARHSAGRPRCDTCHDRFIAAPTPAGRAQGSAA